MGTLQLTLLTPFLFEVPTEPVLDGRIDVHYGAVWGAGTSDQPTVPGGRALRHKRHRPCTPAQPTTGRTDSVKTAETRAVVVMIRSVRQ
ncbi:MAG TPA: hypothetical protein VFI46_06010 [Jiangellaceae bacterium]|nr:hypothetical protein [Jiangellaceae bacterium]